MGFPVGYTEVFIPTLFIHTISFLTLLKNLLHTIFNFLGLPPDYLEPELVDPFYSPHDSFQNPDPNQPDPNNPTPPPPISAVLLRELLPVSHVPDTRAGERCAVCLYEFLGGEEIRWLSNCKHIFHRECIDRWMDLDHRKCPLCRTPFLRDCLLREFNQRLLDHDSHDHGVFDFMHVDNYYYYNNHTGFSPSF